MDVQREMPRRCLSLFVRCSHRALCSLERDASARHCRNSAGRQMARAGLYLNESSGASSRALKLIRDELRPRQLLEHLCLFMKELAWSSARFIRIPPVAFSVSVYTPSFFSFFSEWHGASLFKFSYRGVAGTFLPLRQFVIFFFILKPLNLSTRMQIQLNS